MRLLPLLALLLLAACGGPPTVLTYTAPAGLQRQAGPAVAVSAVDERGDGPDWLGAIRGGFGNPVRTLRGDRPVADSITRAFQAGLEARGLAATPGAAAPATLAITIHKFNANLYLSREATADFTATLAGAGGAPLWSERSRTELSEVTLAGGILADPKDLEAMLDRALSQAVDKVLDNPGFQAALPR